MTILKIFSLKFWVKLKLENEVANLTAELIDFELELRKEARENKKPGSI